MGLFNKILMGLKSTTDKGMTFVKSGREIISAFIPIIKSIRKTVGSQMGLEIYDVIPIDSVPKSGSGKVLRFHLGKKDNNGEFAGTLHQVHNALLRDSGAGIDMGTIFESENIKTLTAMIEQSKAVSERGILYPQIIPDEQGAYEAFPLTEIQIAYLLGREEGYQLGGVSTHSYIELKTELELERLNRALLKLIARHPMLRAVFSGNQQRILKHVPEYIIKVEDVSALSAAGIENRLIAERTRMSYHVFSPEIWPLFEFKALKIREGCHYLLIGLDMLMLDAASLEVIAAELMDFYYDETLEARVTSLSFRDYVLAYKEMKKSPSYETDKKFWLGKIKDFPAAPDLPTKINLSDADKPVFKRVSRLMENNQWEQLKKEAAAYGITPTAMLCTAFLQVLAYWSNQPHLAISLTLVNRFPFHPDVDKLVGDFTSVVPLDADVSAGDLFWERAKSIQKTIMDGLWHHHYEGVEFIRELSAARGYGNKVAIPIVFTSLLANDIWGKWNQIGQANYMISQISQVYLDFQASEIAGQLFINWDYRSDILDDEMVDEMFRQYFELLFSITDNPSGFMPIPDQCIRLVGEYNDTYEDIPPVLLHQAFMEQARNTPEQIAIINGDRKITYRELNEKSNQIAFKLKTLGVGRNHLVGVMADRCPETIVNILGILKAGGAYVPVDSQYPRERVDDIMEHSRCHLLMTADFYSENGLDAYAVKGLEVVNELDDIAYVIYTSGSTGRPKGVVISHLAVMNTIIDINQKLNVGEDDKVLGISSMCFDLSVYDTFGTLISGAALVQIPDQRDVLQLLQVIQKEKITIWNSVPAIMEMLLEGRDKHQTYLAREAETLKGITMNEPTAFEDIFYNTSLRKVLLSGDWIPLSLPVRVKKYFRNAEIVSLGGAAEASIWSIYFPIAELQESWKSIPYGRPLANQQCYVLNYQGDLCPPGVTGELYIGGVGLAKGYYEDKERTSQAFIRHLKFGELYRTGAYGRLLKDGVIEFLGRKDQQVKSRGHQIELSRSTKEAREIVPPGNKVEAAILEIWKQVLKQENIGVKDNFFAVGGDSILLAKVYTKIAERYPDKVDIIDLFTNTSVAAIAGFLRENISWNATATIKGMKLPDKYFAEPMAAAEYNSFMFKLEQSLASGLNQIAKTARISIEELLAVLYIYILSEISGEKEVNMQIMIDEINTVYSVSMDLSEVKQFADLFRGFQGRELSPFYGLDRLSSIPFPTERQSLVIAFLERSRYTFATGLLKDYYDLILIMEESKEEIHFTCVYNGAKLKSNRVKAIIYSYVKLLSAYTDKLK